jgi:hypothetical protein
MGLWRYRSPSGETRLWTVKEIIQGRSNNSLAPEPAPATAAGPQQPAAGA